MLQVEYHPQGFVENVGEALGMMSQRVQGDLERFKEIIEKPGRPAAEPPSEGFSICLGLCPF